MKQISISTPSLVLDTQILEIKGFDEARVDS